jgi:hypothetical protein
MKILWELLMMCHHFLKDPTKNLTPQADTGMAERPFRYQLVGQTTG